MQDGKGGKEKKKEKKRGGEGPASADESGISLLLSRISTGKLGKGRRKPACMTRRCLVALLEFQRGEKSFGGRNPAVNDIRFFYLSRGGQGG